MQLSKPGVLDSDISGLQLYLSLAGPVASVSPSAKGTDSSLLYRFIAKVTREVPAQHIWLLLF